MTEHPTRHTDPMDPTDRIVGDGQPRPVERTAEEWKEEMRRRLDWEPVPHFEIGTHVEDCFREAIQAAEGRMKERCAELLDHAAEENTIHTQSLLIAADLVRSLDRIPGNVEKVEGRAQSGRLAPGIVLRGGVCPDCKHYHSQHDKKYGCTIEGCECLRLR